MIRIKIGILLCSLYLLQYFMQIEWAFLENLQNDPIYRRWSGLALFLLILSQWLLSIYRGIYGMKGEVLEEKVDTHVWLGVISPLFFFLHSTKPDYGLLFFLFVIFFLNLLWGFLNIKNAINKRLQYFRIWLAVHILFSASVLMLTLLHIWLVFYYN